MHEHNYADCHRCGYAIRPDCLCDQIDAANEARQKIAALETDARRLAEIVEMARDYDDDFKGAGWSLRCKLINWGLIKA